MSFWPQNNIYLQLSRSFTLRILWSMYWWIRIEEINNFKCIWSFKNNNLQFSVIFNFKKWGVYLKITFFFPLGDRLLKIFYDSCIAELELQTKLMLNIFKVSRITFPSFQWFLIKKKTWGFYLKMTLFYSK
jgi:hypothetical protein